MKRIVAAVILALSTAFSFSALSDDAKTTPAEMEANYTRAIEGRAEEILKVLDLKDAAKADAVRKVIVAQYRALRDWHDRNDGSLKFSTKEIRSTDTNRADRARMEVERINGTLKKLHDEYIAQLGAELTPSQVEQVKDKMVYNKVQVTFNAYCAMYPTLTDEQKAKILSWLKEAREEAMDGGSADEKSAVFNRYKGKINNMISAAGLKKTNAK